MNRHTANASVILCHAGFAGTHGSGMVAEMIVGHAMRTRSRSRSRMRVIVSVSESWLDQP